MTRKGGPKRGQSRSSLVAGAQIQSKEVGQASGGGKARAAFKPRLATEARPAARAHENARDRVGDAGLGGAGSGP